VRIAAGVIELLLLPDTRSGSGVDPLRFVPSFCDLENDRRLARVGVDL